MLGAIEGSEQGVAAVAGQAGLAAGAGHCANFAGGVNDAEGMATAFEDVDIAPIVDGAGARIDERRFFCDVAVFGHAALAVAGNEVDLSALDIKYADAAVFKIGNVDLIAFLRETDAIDAAELGFKRGTAIAFVF